MSVCPSVCLYVPLPVCLSVSLYVFLSVCLSALISTISHQQANMQREDPMLYCSACFCRNVTNRIRSFFVALKVIERANPHNDCNYDDEDDFDDADACADVPHQPTVHPSHHLPQLTSSPPPVLDNNGDTSIETFSNSIRKYSGKGVSGNSHAPIRYLPSLLIQFLCTVCTASCRM